MNKTSMLYRTLARALSVKRPHGGAGVATLGNWLLSNIPDMTPVHTDAIGNIHVDMRSAPEHRTLFVAHIDTVHHEDGPNKITKTRTAWMANGAPLGADDGAGVALLMHMIDRGVAAYYVFTQGEECGGIGAKFLAKNHSELLKEFDRAVAFDRRGTDSVITSQFRGECCSREFAETLSDELNGAIPSFMYSPDDTGIYTDTAEFIDVIPECTNISCAYYDEHSAMEMLNLDHFKRLSRAILNVNWDGLPVVRKPGIEEYAVNKGVWGLDGELYDYADMHADGDIEELLYALDEAWAGDTKNLITMIADAVYPEEPNLMIARMDSKYITPALLDKAYQWCETYPAHEVMLNMFDEIYLEA